MTAKSQIRLAGLLSTGFILGVTLFCIQMLMIALVSGDQVSVAFITAATLGMAALLVTIGAQFLPSTAGQRAIIKITLMGMSTAEINAATPELLSIGGVNRAEAAASIRALRRVLAESEAEDRMRFGHYAV